MLESEFLEPLGMDAEALADLIGAAAAHIRAVIAGEAPMDAELDLRLGR